MDASHYILTRTVARTSPLELVYGITLRDSGMVVIDREQ